MSDTPEQRFAKLADGWLQRSIAADVWPNGVVLRCKGCGYSEPITTAEAGRYLAHGWPSHCRSTMRVESATSTPNVRPRPALEPDPT